MAVGGKTYLVTLPSSLPLTLAWDRLGTGMSRHGSCCWTRGSLCPPPHPLPREATYSPVGQASDSTMFSGSCQGTVSSAKCPPLPLAASTGHSQSLLTVCACGGGGVPGISLGL